MVLAALAERSDKANTMRDTIRMQRSLEVIRVLIADDTSGPRMRLLLVQDVCNRALLFPCQKCRGVEQTV